MPITHTVTLYRITASYARDGQTIDCTQAEVLGDAYGVTYPDRSSAEAAAEELQSDVEPVEHDLDASTRYQVVEYPIQVYRIETAPSDGAVEVTAEVLCADYQGSTAWTAQPRHAGACRVDGLEPAGSSIDAWVDSDIARRLTAPAGVALGMEILALAGRAVRS